MTNQWPEGIAAPLELPCACCGDQPSFDFTVDDAIWKAAIPHAFRRSVVCLRCFSGLADLNAPGWTVLRVQFAIPGLTIELLPGQVHRYAKGEESL